MKKSDFDIERLKRKRQLNVQEQIVLKKHSIKTFAQYWRQHDLPIPLMQLLASKNIDMNTSILIVYNHDFPGGYTDEGIIVTPKGRFLEFWIDLNEDRTQLIDLGRWKDITDEYEINGHKKGIGKTYGFLVLEVLEELNNKVSEE